MADGVDDSLRIEVELALEKADRDYEALRKRIEGEPIRVPLEVAGGGNVATGEPRMARSFAGTAAPLADVPLSTAQRAEVTTVHQQVQQASAMRGGAPVEGAFLGGVGRVPTASLNSVYGSVGHDYVSTPYGTVQALPGNGPAVQAAQTVRHMGTVPRADLGYGVGEEIGFQPRTSVQTARAIALRNATAGVGPAVPGATTATAAQPPVPQSPNVGVGAARPDPVESAPARVRRANRLTAPDPEDFADPAREARAAAGLAGLEAAYPTVAAPGRLRRAFPNLGGYFGGYAALNAVGSAAGAQTQYGVAMAQAGGDPYALARAQIDNNPTQNFVGGIPLVGGIATQIGGAISGSPVAVAQALAGAGLRDAVTEANRQRGQSLFDARGTLGVTQAGLAGSVAGEIAAIGQNTAGSAARRQDFIQANGQAARDQLQAANARLQTARSAIANGVAVDVYNKTFGGYDGERRQVQFDASGRAITEFAGAKRVREDDYRKLTEFNSAFDAANDARSALAQVGARATEIEGLSNATDVTRLRGIRQGQDDAAAATATGRQYFNESRSLAASGESTNARLAAVNEQYQPQIRQAQAEIDRLKATDRSKYTEEQNRAFFATLSAAEGGRDALAERQAAAAGDVVTDYTRTGIRLRGDAAATGYALRFEPAAAARAQREADYQAAITTSVMRKDGSGYDTVTAAFGSETERRARQARDNGNALSLQQSVLAQQVLGNSLGAEGRSLDYALARNTVGAQAAGMSGEAINRIQAIRRQGEQFAGQAEEARQNALKGFDVLRQDYALSFRGQQFDAQNVLVANPRDAQDPTEVFRSINEERDRVRDAKADDGKVTEEIAKVVTAVKDLPRDIVGAAMQLLAN